MTDLFTHCEHLMLWGVTQPLNLLSSTVFWCLAWWLYHQHRPKLWSYPFWLVAGIELIGWCSLIWHFTHGPVGVVLDVFSVVFWLICFSAYAWQQKVGWSYLKGTLFAVMFIALAWGLGRALNPWLAQSSAAFIPIAILMLWAGQRDHNQWWTYSGLTLIAATALRVLDMPLCHAFPLGTHWLWHLGSAFSLYAAMRAVLISRK